MIRLARAFVVVLSLTALAACGKVQAKAPTPPPALTPPAPPSPLITPTTIEYTEPVKQPTEAAAPAQPASSRTTTPPSKPAGNAATPPATSTPPPPDTPATTTPVLETTNSSEVERDAKDKIESANRDLGRVTYTTLSKDGKDSYDSAKRFIRNAEDYLRTRNFSLALSMAKKAAELAAQLPKSDT